MSADKATRPGPSSSSAPNSNKATGRTDEVRASDKAPVISDRSTESLRRDSTDDDANGNEKMGMNL